MSSMDEQKYIEERKETRPARGRRRDRRLTLHASRRSTACRLRSRHLRVPRPAASAATATPAAPRMPTDDEHPDELPGGEGVRPGHARADPREAGQDRRRRGGAEGGLRRQAGLLHDGDHLAGCWPSPAKKAGDDARQLEYLPRWRCRAGSPRTSRRTSRPSIARRTTARSTASRRCSTSAIRGRPRRFEVKPVDHAPVKSTGSCRARRDVHGCGLTALRGGESRLRSRARSGTPGRTTSCSTTTCTSRSRTRWSIRRRSSARSSTASAARRATSSTATSDGGGGSADAAKSIYERKVEPVVEKHLADRAGGRHQAAGRRSRVPP